jgi:urease accessory protein
MGRQVCRMATEQPDQRLLLVFFAEVQSGRSPGHLAVSLGLVLGTCGWRKQEAIAAYLYQALVGYVSAALRLLPVGQREGQRLLTRWLPLIEEVSRTAERQRQMSCWTPVQDIYGMRHHRLTTRLFRS